MVAQGYACFVSNGSFLGPRLFRVEEDPRFSRKCDGFAEGCQPDGGGCRVSRGLFGSHGGF